MAAVIAATLSACGDQAHTHSRPGRGPLPFVQPMNLDGGALIVEPRGPSESSAIPEQEADLKFRATVVE